MNLSELRKQNNNMTQSELVSKMQKQGIKCDISEISRIENGCIERYLFIADKAINLFQQNNMCDNNLQAVKGACKPSKCGADMLNIYNDGQWHADSDFVGRIGWDEREIRHERQLLKYEYAIIVGTQGTKLATDNDLDLVNRQLRKYENQKKIINMQERVLIAKKYEIEHSQKKESI
jgi:hypothetical protein